MPLSPDSLAAQLQMAAAACAAVRQGTALPQALTKAARGIAPGPRGAVQDIAYRSMRQRGLADALLARLVDRAPAEAVRELLVCALAQLADPEPPYSAHALVDQAVEAAPQRAKGFVNAVLRRYLREGADLRAALAGDVVARRNFPAWWVELLQRDHPVHWQDILAASQRPGPMTLRVNRRRATREQVLAAFADADLQAHAVAGIGAWPTPDAVVLDTPRAVQALPGFADGWWSVQDAGAQLAAPLLAVEPGMRVLDACAAPGGKTGHLLEGADCELLALDADAARLTRVEENLRRLGLSAELRAADAARIDDWWDGREFDRILADVPCTASGIVRRHPDIRWLRRRSDIDQLATTAATILDALWRVLKPDGTMLFATCSVFVQESETQAQHFLARHPDAVRLEAPGQLLPADTDALDHDGFFYARVAKRVRR
jgi:16S rRNA (cytosine967-C5)-methyltransferase